MLLTKRTNVLSRDDSGSTMLAVLGLTAVTAVISLTVVSSTINGLGFTSSTRAGVQARAAAEAGVDQALVDLQGTCVTTYDSVTDPHFEYELSYSISSTVPSWNTGCPTNDATLVRILSTGYAASPGVAGASSGDERTVEAIYANVPVYVEVPQAEPAVYAHTMDGVFRNFVLDSASDTFTADVQIKNGNVICENSATIDGDVILANGYVELNRCDVNGTIHVSKYVDIDGTGTIVEGDVIALGEGVAAGSDVVRLRSGTGEVQGGIYSSGNILIEDRVLGSAALSGSSSNDLRVTSSGEVQGDVVSSGTTNIEGIVGGSVSSTFVGLAPLSAPRVPDWTDIPYPTTSWDGYTVATWSGSCSIGNSHPFWDSLATLTASVGNVVVDARSCGEAGLDFQNNIRDLVLSANLSFVAWKFNVDKVVVASNNSDTRYLWFMVPDNVIDEQPTCPSPVNAAEPAGTITLTNEADIDPTISAFAYTPCKIISDRNYWRGQLFGGTMEFLQQAQLTYVPVGVPGVDFDASLPPVMALSDSLLGDRVSFREVNNGG